uniref:Uncharacterized protein n=1 Tax=Peronospora matthiolae TaxID=2874970 RepID=A0AAV1T5B3_9STRA
MITQELGDRFRLVAHVVFTVVDNELYFDSSEVLERLAADIDGEAVKDCSVGAGGD